MQHAAGAALHDERDAEQGTHLAQHRIDDDPSRFLAVERQRTTLRQDPSGESLAGRDRYADGLLLDAVRGADRQVTALVGQQHGGVVDAEDLAQPPGELGEEIVETQVGQRRLGHAVKVAGPGGYLPLHRRLLELPLRPLAIADIRHAAADEDPLVVRESHPPDLACHVGPVGAPVHPFEHRRPSRDRLADELAGRLRRAPAIRLDRRAQVDRAAFKQPLPRKLEQLRGVLVDLVKAPSVHVEHDDRLRRVLHQRAVASLTGAELLIGVPPLRDVLGGAEDRDRPSAAVEYGLADPDHGSLLTVGSDDPKLVRRGDSLLERAPATLRHAVAIIGMDDAGEGLERRLDRPRLKSEEPVQPVGPPHRVGLEVPSPRAESGDALRLRVQRGDLSFVLLQRRRHVRGARLALGQGVSLGLGLPKPPRIGPNCPPAART